jgi:putative transposase
MMRTASIKLEVTVEQANRLGSLRAAYADACNRLVPIVREHRVWNRVALHNLAYAETPLGSQMCCNAIYSVCKAYKAQSVCGRIQKIGRFLKSVSSAPASISTSDLHAQGRDAFALYAGGAITVSLRLGEHQRRLIASGRPKEAELVFRQGKWFFHLIVESSDVETRASGPVMGVDVGENNLAATSTGKVFGGGELRHRRDRYLALRRRLQSNGSQSAKQKLRQVSGKERRRVTHVNHETSKAIVEEAKRMGAAKIVMEDLTDIRRRIRSGKRMRARLHRWAFRQLQDFVEYKAKAAGIAVEYVNPAYTSQTCSACGARGRRHQHRFVCDHCGLRAHSDLNASRNLARIGETAVSPRAAVNTPDVGEGHGLRLR